MKKNGFTLLELLLLVAFVGVLLAVAVKVFEKPIRHVVTEQKK